MSLFQVEFPSGLIYVPNWLSEEEHAAALEEIDNHQFESTLARRVQHYGSRYDYFASELKDAGSAPPIPPVLSEIGNRLFSEGYFDKLPSQVIINEYLTDQGIASHIDKNTFGPAVATISLLESWTMQFSDPNGIKIEVPLEARSLAVMTHESRYVWSHGIAKRKADVVGGLRIPRVRRLSMTYRTTDNPKL